MHAVNGATLGITAALASALAWAVGAILFRRIGERASPTAMNLAKSLVGLVLIGAGAFAAGLSAVDGGSVIRLALSGVLGIAVGDSLFFAALIRLEARLTLLLATVGHVFTVVAAAAILGERPTLVVWAGIALVIIGVGGVLQAGASAGESVGESVGSERGLGIACGVLSAAATSAGLLLAKTGVTHVGTLQGTWIRLAAGVVALAIWAAIRGHLRADLAVLRLPGFVHQIAIAVTVVMFGGFWLSLVSLKFADASIVSALAATEPIFILPLARLWLHEKVTWPAIIGAVVAVAGVTLIVLGVGTPR